MQAEKIEKRKGLRAKVNFPGFIWYENMSVGGVISDISVTGVMISADKPIPLDVKCKIKFSIPNDRDLELDGQVVRSDLYGIGPKDDVYCLGMSFVKVHCENRGVLNTLIQTLSR